MSNIRPELVTSRYRGLGYRDSYYRIAQSVSGERRLIRGRLKIGGDVCAVGSYFERGPGDPTPIDARAIHEIATYNDSLHTETPEERWRKVTSWLRFKVARMRKGLE